MKRKWKRLFWVSMIIMTMLFALPGCGGKGGKGKDAALSELLWRNEVSIWYYCGMVDKEEEPYVYVIYGDGTYIKASGYSLGELSKMKDEEIVTWAENEWKNRDTRRIPSEITELLLDEDSANKKRYGLSLYTDSTGNQVQYETIYFESEDSIKIVQQSDNFRPVSGTVYESFYIGYLTNKGRCFLCRTENTTSSCHLDALGTDNVLIDEEVVFSLYTQNRPVLHYELPESFNERDRNGWHVPDGTANITVDEFQYDSLMFRYTQEAFCRMTEYLYMQNYGDEVDVECTEFKSSELNGCRTLLTRTSLNLNGVEIEQVQFAVEVGRNRVTTITYTQEAGGEWMDAFNASVDSMSIDYVPVNAGDSDGDGDGNWGIW